MSMWNWSAQAECRGKPQRWWFPEDSRFENGNAQRAKEVCAICPVQTECLQFAITTNQEYGIWGGLDRQERRKQRKYRIIYCNSCGRRFSWIPGVPSDRPPRFCSGLCTSNARRRSRADSYQRRKREAS